MSRSYKKAIFSISCAGLKGQKQWKRDYNRVFRHKQNAELKMNDVDVALYEVPYKTWAADIWTSPSDGHHRYDVTDYKCVCKRSPEWAKRVFCPFMRHNSILAWK